MVPSAAMRLDIGSSWLPFRTALVVVTVACVAGSGCSMTPSYACGCVTGRVEWGNTGGLAPTAESSALDACYVFTHRRITSGEPDATCEHRLDECNYTIGAEDVKRAIAHADVQAAMSAAPVLYGEDLTKVDGTVFRIQIQNATINVGSPCATQECKAVPTGVDALATMLQKLTMQELARGQCRSTFPPQAN